MNAPPLVGGPAAFLSLSLSLSASACSRRSFFEQRFQDDDEEVEEEEEEEEEEWGGGMNGSFFQFGFLSLVFFQKI